MSWEGHAREYAEFTAAEAVRAGQNSPTVRGGDWRLATVSAVNGDGTVDADDIPDVRCIESYLSPTVGDVIRIDHSGNGNWLAMGRLATAADAVGSWRSARKTADTARGSTTTTADPHLTFPNLVAGAVYEVDGWIKYSADAAADITLDWTVPDGTLGEWTGTGASIDTAGAANGYSVQVASTDVDSARSFGGAGAGATLTIDIKGTLRVGSAGTYSLLWAQRVTNAVDTTVHTDSWLRLHRTA
ncbi:hypothetical protein [Streptomyces cadmiisoli]|uniref:hypothetical protein n=1 Tax=Streptomyces cadmiisoli TaxID=2184053 RepID=UPI003666CAB7